MAIQRYGYEFPNGTTDLTIELKAYRDRREPEQGGLGPFEHFRRATDLIYNNPRVPASRGFKWSPWAEDMIYEAIMGNFLGCAGCASSGKSDAYALWGIMNYLCSPYNTLVMMTSTTLREARRRIWKSVMELWLAAKYLPGKPVTSLGLIKGLQSDGSYGESTGLTLVPAERKKEKDAIGKLAGIKQQRVFLVADELPELPESLLNVAVTNLSTNPYFHMVGIGNPNSYFDAFGVLCEPKGGWDTVTENDYEWDTVLGKCIRFDATQNPNLDNPGEYPWMPSQESIDRALAKYGEHSLMYYRMFKGFWFPDGNEFQIYTAADLISGRASHKVEENEWDSEPVLYAGLDPSFTQGGDRAILRIGRLGEIDGIETLEYTETLTLQENMQLKDQSRSKQLAKLLKKECEQRGIEPRNVGVDETGGGGPFLDVVREEWSFEVRGVKFGGKASDRPVSADELDVPGHERYHNRATELWFQGTEMVRCGQIKGVTSEQAKEMTARIYLLKPGGKVQVEPKKDFKIRTGYSPDVADASFVLLEVAREEAGFIPGLRLERSKEKQEVWAQRTVSLNDVYEDLNLLDD